MPLADGVEDPLVHARRVFQVPEAGARDHPSPPVVIQLRHHLDQRRDDRVARRRGDRPMEVDVVHEEAVSIGQRREHSPHLDADGLDLRRRGPLGGQARGADLEDAPRLVHLLAREPVQRGEKAQRLAAERRRPVGNIRAGPAPRLDDADGRQGFEPGTHGRPAHADVHGQLALGRQPIAGTQRAALDPRANVAHDLVGARFAAASVADRSSWAVTMKERNYKPRAPQARGPWSVGARSAVRSPVHGPRVAARWSYDTHL